MDELTLLRSEIDAADADIVAALSRRFAVSDHVRQLKKANGLPPIDPVREHAICERAMAGVPAAHRDTVFSIYERILGGSRGMVETVSRGVAVFNGRILLCRSKGGDATYLPGGHIEFGESGRDALVREIKEELGVSSKCGRFLGVVENSFVQFDRPHAEINLVYEIAEIALPVGNGTGVEAVASREDWIEFVWWPLADLRAANLLPEAFRAIGENPGVSFSV